MTLGCYVRKAYQGRPRRGHHPRLHSRHAGQLGEQAHFSTRLIVQQMKLVAADTTTDSVCTGSLNIAVLLGSTRFYSPKPSATLCDYHPRRSDSPATAIRSDHP